MRRTGVNICFYYESKFFNFFFGFGGGVGNWWVGVSTVSDFLFDKGSKSKKKIFFWGGIGVWGEGRLTNRRTGPNQFAPSTSSKLGA